MEMEPTLAALAPDLLRLALGLTGSREEAEDLAQEALASLVRYWRSNGPPDSPAAFACTVVRRQALRSSLRRRSLTPMEETDRPDRAPLPDEAVHHGLRLDRALAALDALEAGDREAILLVAAGGLNVEEAAGVLGISASAFKMRIHRARQRLARVMETDHGREEERPSRAV